MKYVRQTRRWFDKTENGIYQDIIVEYTLYFKGKDLIDIRNGSGHSVEQGSDCWDYFTRKINAGLI